MRTSTDRLTIWLRACLFLITTVMICKTFLYLYILCLLHSAMFALSKARALLRSLQLLPRLALPCCSQRAFANTKNNDVEGRERLAILDKMAR